MHQQIQIHQPQQHNTRNMQIQQRRPASAPSPPTASPRPPLASFPLLRRHRGAPFCIGAFTTPAFAAVGLFRAAAFLVAPVARTFSVLPSSSFAGNSPSPASPAADYTHSKSRTAPLPEPATCAACCDSPPASAPAPTPAAATQTAATSPDSSPAAPPARGLRSPAAGYSHRLPS